MKIVDKYGLAQEKNGTPFYNVDKYGSIYSPLKILDGSQFTPSWHDNKPFFNGVTYLEPDCDLDNGCSGGFTEDHLPDKMKLFNVDDDSNNYGDDDKFLILDKDELKVIIDYLSQCYDTLQGV